jgi:hypothetical protein
MTIVTIDFFPSLYDWHLLIRREATQERRHTKTHRQALREHTGERSHAAAPLEVVTKQPMGFSLPYTPGALSSFDDQQLCSAT